VENLKRSDGALFFFIDQTDEANRAHQALSGESQGEIVWGRKRPDVK
jgi:hypothetical protein